MFGCYRETSHSLDKLGGWGRGPLRRVEGKGRGGEGRKEYMGGRKGWEEDLGEKEGRTEP